MRRVPLFTLAASLLFGQAGPTERQAVDPQGAQRGRALYAQHCINCHGALAKGVDEGGPDLIRSPLILRDRLGSELAPALRTLPEHPRSLTAAQVTDITHFLKDQIESTAKNRNPVKPPNVLTGNAARGREFFTARCTSCHSSTGDLAGIGRKYDPVDLQQRFLFPRSSKPKLVTADGITGDLVRIDTFYVTLRDANGEQRTVKRTPTVVVTDPLAEHIALLDVYTDQNIHDIVTYLESLK